LIIRYVFKSLAVSYRGIENKLGILIFGENRLQLWKFQTYVFGKSIYGTQIDRFGCDVTTVKINFNHFRCMIAWKKESWKSIVLKTIGLEVNKFTIFCILSLFSVSQFFSYGFLRVKKCYQLFLGQRAVAMRHHCLRKFRIVTSRRNGLFIWNMIKCWNSAQFCCDSGIHLMWSHWDLMEVIIHQPIDNKNRISFFEMLQEFFRFW